MKILKLIFENINSLKGKWQIDFTDPAFNGNAIFAITGATGAGKTTILDAICLALYGETPRLNAFSDEKGNELMSIGTAHTSSEVIFSVNGEIYRAFWSQRRARQKADGKLQPIVRELAKLTHLNDENGKILEEKASLVKSAIEKLLGMNKEQFTRSVLLAQGDFASFLKSDANSRGEILERITGTQIYANIGKAAFEKNKDLQAKLNELKIRQGDIRLLNDDELHALHDDLAKSQAAQNNLNQQAKQVNEQLSLAKTYANNQAEYQHWQTQYQNSKQAIDDFAPQQQILTLANTALSLLPSHQAYQEDKLTLKNQQNILDNLQKSLPILQQNHQDSLQAVTQKNQAYLTAKQNHESQKPIIEQVRTMEQNLALVQQNASQAQYQYHDEQDKYQKLKQKIHACQTQINQLNERQKQLANGTLNESQLALLHHHNTQLPITHQRIQNALSGIQKDHQVLTNIYHHASEKLNDLNDIWNNFQNSKDTLKQKNDQVTNLQNQLANLLSVNLPEQISPASFVTQYITPLHERHKELLEQKENLQKTQEQLTQKTPMLAELQVLDEQFITKSSEQQQLQSQINELNAQLDTAKTLQQSLAESFELHKQILHMKTHFDRLHDGDPCPLCGATEHPYKEKTNHLDGSQAKITEEKLNNQSKIVEKLTQQIKQNEIDLIKVDEQLTHIAQQKQQINSKLKQIDGTIAQLWQESTALNDSTINQKLNDLNIKLNHTHNIINQSQSLLSEYQQALHEQAQATTLCENLFAQGKAKRIEVEGLKEQFIQNQNTLTEQIATTIALQNSVDFVAIADHLGIHHQPELQNHIQYLLNNITQNLPQVLHLKPDGKLSHLGELYTLPNGCFNAYLTYFAQATQALAQLNDTQNQLAEQKQRLQSELNSQITLQNELAEQKAKMQIDLDNLNKRLSNLQSDLQSQQAQRFDICSEPDINAFENRLILAIENTQKQLQNAESTRQYNESELNKVIAGIEHNNATLQTLNQKQQQSWQKFSQALSASNFSDETQFLNALLPDDELTKLTAMSQQLQADLQQAQISLQNTEQKQKQLIADYPDIALLRIDELTAQAENLQSEQNTLSQTIGEINAQLTIDQQNRNQQQDLLEKIHNKERETAIWSALNALIGSSDGQKYRNFVQGLTLDLVLHHANLALQKMNDRYLLTHDSSRSQLLEIMVIDIHQGDSVRSSKNLSGGETFIISLALALGLSQINSQNIHIESLFLDEGFGTLDENALDLALSTLFELQQNGKNIGIISHVASLKERIDTQIVLEKQAAGRSMMHGAGVTRLS